MHKRTTYLNLQTSMLFALGIANASLVNIIHQNYCDIRAPPLDKVQGSIKKPLLPKRIAYKSSHMVRNIPVMAHTLDIDKQNIRAS